MVMHRTSMNITISKLSNLIEYYNFSVTRIEETISIFIGLEDNWNVLKTIKDNLKALEDNKTSFRQ